MAQIAWTAEALDDRRSIWDFIAADDLMAARKMDALFARAIERLGELPYLGKPGRISNTRELVPHRNYRIVYEVHRDLVIILALVHTARQWPPLG